MTNCSTPDSAPSEEELTHAIALFYDGQSAPVIAALGKDAIADEILAIAKKSDVPICTNPALTELLSQMNVGDHIPEELYLCVAHILAFAYRLNDHIINYETQ